MGLRSFLLRLIVPTDPPRKRLELRRVRRERAKRRGGNGHFWGPDDRHPRPAKRTLRDGGPGFGFGMSRTIEEDPK